VLVTLSVAGSGRAQTSRKLATDQRVLTGTEWRLVSLGPAGAAAHVLPGTNATLNFEDNGRAGGSTGCNSYGGSYQVRGDGISFSRLISTRRACLDQNANQQERRFLSALEAASRFRLTENRLTILSDRGRNVLNFVNNSEAEPDDKTTTERGDPLAALVSYYDAINARDYRRAYRYWETPASSFEQFARGFADTERVHLLVDPSPRFDGAAGSAYAEIFTVVVTTTRAGSERVFAGCYVLRRSNVQDRGWHIYRADVLPVSSGASLSRILSQSCRN